MALNPSDQELELLASHQNGLKEHLGKISQAHQDIQTEMKHRAKQQEKFGEIAQSKSKRLVDISKLQEFESAFEKLAAHNAILEKQVAKLQTRPVHDKPAQNASTSSYSLLPHSVVTPEPLVQFSITRTNSSQNTSSPQAQTPQRDPQSQPAPAQQPQSVQPSRSSRSLLDLLDDFDILINPSPQNIQANTNRTAGSHSTNGTNSAFQNPASLPISSHTLSAPTATTLPGTTTTPPATTTLPAAVTPPATSTSVVTAPTTIPTTIVTPPATIVAPVVAEVTPPPPQVSLQTFRRSHRWG